MRTVYLDTDHPISNVFERGFGSDVIHDEHAVGFPEILLRDTSESEKKNTNMKI